MEKIYPVERGTDYQTGRDMKKIYPVQPEIDYQTGNLKRFCQKGAGVDASAALWPVYAPYQVTDEELFSEDYRQARQVWEAEGELVDGVTFINPAKEMSLLHDFLAVDIWDNQSILAFVNRYGLLGISFRKSPLWIVSQVPVVSYGVEREDLHEFQCAAQTLKESYNLWESGENQPLLLRRFRHGLAGGAQYPQLNSYRRIVPGVRGLTLLDNIWLHFYNLAIGKDWFSCDWCGSLFEKEHGHNKYCPPCRELPTPPRHLKRRKPKREQSSP
ncbi:MAG: hypothetical protein DDT37_01266 [Firmicutes bacterium]|nr:hypothetical protein [candidate division NPL-UPA2 bacterium]